ncbi:MAG: hypothetical protein LC637_03400, partial [Xanthomonadaceae bacterium]|nr:hypothetical protein [Xanthomonadaceae bacterium]
CTPEDTSGLYLTQADIDPFGPDLGAVHDVTVALVGLHIVTKPVNHPEWVWATFEFADNAPDCSGASNRDGTDWLFYNPSCEGPFCETNVYCDPCSGNCGAEVTLDPQCKATPIPTQVCRYYPIDTMNPSGTVSQLNASVVRSAPADSIFGSYQLVGALYTQYGSTGGNDTGSPFLANLTMETYKQDDHRIGIPPNTGCFTCHSRVFTALGTKNGGQGDFSHSFKNIQQAGACAASLPSYCPDSGLLGRPLPDS